MTGARHGEGEATGSNLVGLCLLSRLGCCVRPNSRLNNVH